MPFKNKLDKSIWNAAHYQANKTSIRMRHVARRHTKQNGKRHPDHSFELEGKLRQQARELLVATGVEYVVDHIIPLNYGGWHHHDNLQLLPRLLNTLKRDDPFWYICGYKCWLDVPRLLWPKSLYHEYDCRTRELILGSFSR